MEHLKKIGAGFLDSVGGNRNKPPPDDLMVSCKDQLTDLRDEIMIVKQQFSNYAHQVVEAAEASVTLSKSVDRFYSKANHPGRSESVNMYKKVQEDIANRAVNTFHITVENGLISELSEWIQLVANLNDKILAAESTRLSAHDTQNRLQALQNEHSDKKSSKKTLFSGNRDKEIEDLQKRINESTEAQKSLSLDYQNQRNNIAQQVKQLMEKRYRYFDRIYVQMLECQSEYFQHAANISKRFKRDIDYYRKQYPKTNDFHVSNGSSGDLHGLANTINDEGQGLLHANSNQKTNEAQIENKNKPKVPTTKPPKKNSRKNSKIKNNKGYIDETMNTNNHNDIQNNTASQSQAQSQAQSHINPSISPQMQSKSAGTSPQTKPLMNQSNINDMSNGNHMNTNTALNNHINNASELSQPPAYEKQRSTHDILNLDGPMSPQPPKPVKQDSLMTGLFGHMNNNNASNNNNSNSNNNNNAMNDHHGLFNLGDADSNDMLNMHGNNNQNQNNKRQQNNNSNNMQALREEKSGDPNDFFGDFFGGNSAANKLNKPMHPKQDSTSDWLRQMNEPAQPKQNNNDNNNMEEQMRKTMNKPSFNGHNSPQIVNSTTGKVPKNGAAAAKTMNNTDLSSSDKQKLANMKLSKKGQENARKAYDDKMAQRQVEADKAAAGVRETAYWKEKHEQKLNHWEFDATVRRNIRTLIGKLPEVLPSNLNWKPIPMTKLLNDATLKKGYYKAIRVVHPDKSSQRGDSIENQVVCDYVFQALEQGFNTKFG